MKLVLSKNAPSYYVESFVVTGNRRSGKEEKRSGIVRFYSLHISNIFFAFIKKLIGGSSEISLMINKLR